VAVDSFEAQSTTPAGKALLAIYEGGGGCFRGSRPVHAKGTLCRGRFFPSLAASRLTTARHMQGGPVDVAVRFSNASSNPHSLDNALDVRGMATKFYVPGTGAKPEQAAHETDIVAVTLPCFFVNEPEQFPAFARAQRSGFTRLGYIALHPTSWNATFALGRAGKPKSYATCRFNAIHAYRWTDARGGERYVRYSWIPLAGVQKLPRRRARKGGENYLAYEIQERLRAAPVRFKLQLQIAGPNDSTRDPSTIWRSPTTVDAGTLELTRADLEPASEDLVFDPNRLTPGIDPSDDPLLLFRPAVYEMSSKRRSARTCP
jgi:catalase